MGQETAQGDRSCRNKQPPSWFSCKTSITCSFYPQDYLRSEVRPHCLLDSSKKRTRKNKPHRSQPHRSQLDWLRQIRTLELCQHRQSSTGPSWATATLTDATQKPCMQSLGVSRSSQSTVRTILAKGLAPPREGSVLRNEFPQTNAVLCTGSARYRAALSRPHGQFLVTNFLGLVPNVSSPSTPLSPCTAFLSWSRNRQLT